MDISFVVVTNGKRKEKTDLVIKSILYQKIPNFEILVCGEYPEGKDYTFIKEKKGARGGLLGKMRNKACERAKYGQITVLDDDMILSRNWYKSLINKGEDFDIVTSQVKLPDGTRFWDHCCYRSPKYGHVILNENENDDHLYMSGGQAWVMKKHVFENVKWSEGFSTGDRASMKNLKDYSKGKDNEDTEFSQRCRDRGYKISHNHDMKAFHDDDRYTCVGRIVRMRKNPQGYKWIRDYNFYVPPEEIANQGKMYWMKGFQAEAADILRKGVQFHFRNIVIEKALAEIEMSMGGRLNDHHWSSDGDEEYTETLKEYKE